MVMKRLGLAMIAGLLLAGTASPSLAQTAPKPGGFRLCTGGEMGNYYRAGNYLKRHAERSVPITVMPTEGSIDNLNKITAGECDGGLVQADVMLTYAQRNAAAISVLERSGVLYQELVHLLCNRDAGINRVTKLTDKITIAVGPEGGGARETWRAFVLADKKRYERVRLDDRTGNPAFAAASDGADIQCVLWVGALGSPFMKSDAQRYGDKLVLVGADDGDMDGAKDNRGRPIYSYTEIPASTYPAIQPRGWLGSSAVKTVAVDALLVVNRDWTRLNPKAYDALLRGMANAKPDILKLVMPNS